MYFIIGLLLSTVLLDTVKCFENGLSERERLVFLFEIVCLCATTAYTVFAEMRKSSGESDV